MDGKLDWIELLNAETQWQNRDDMLNWFSERLGKKLHLGGACIERVEKTIERMRDSLDALHFEEQAKLDWLNAELGEITFTVGTESELPEGLSKKLPLLHAVVSGKGDDQILKAVVDTILLQFGQFIGSVVDSPEGKGIARCEGVYRLGGNEKLSPVRSIPADREMRWRKEIDLLKDHALDATDVQRCADIFVASPKGRFCSDACRFSTFQLTKQLTKPGYHAEKQKRYRDKLKSN